MSAGDNPEYSYAYDGLGNCIQQSIQTLSGTDVTDYLIDMQPGLVNVLAATTGANTDRYIHGPRGIHAQEDNTGTWTWMVQDGLGSVRGEADNAAAIVSMRQYAPYGEPFDTVGTVASDYGYSGELTDPNGLLHLRARYYAPGIAAFTALDPFEGYFNHPMSLNGYSYVHGDPVNWTDPSGEIFPLLAAAAPIAAGFIAGGLIGGAFDAGLQIAGNLASGMSLGNAISCVNLGQVARSALEGAILGAITGGIGGLTAKLGIKGFQAAATLFLSDIAIGTAWDISVNGRNPQDALRDNLLFGLVPELAGSTIGYAISRQINQKSALRSIANILNSPNVDKRLRGRTAGQLRNVRGQPKPNFPGFVQKQALEENVAAIRKLRGDLSDFNPDVVLGVERGGAFPA